MAAHIATKLLFLMLVIVCIGSIETIGSECNYFYDFYEQPSLYFELSDYSARITQAFEEGIKNFTRKGTIKKLKLIRPKIRNIHENLFEGYTDLTHLTIIESGIEEIEKNAFAHLPNLEYLDLSENKLSKLFDYMFEDLTKLKKLVLNDNLIDTIDSSQFSNLTNLRELQIKNNQLRSIYGNTFMGLTSVEIIDLSGNQISYIQEKSFDSCKSLKRLTIENPKQLVIKSLWSSPSNFELVIVNSVNSVEDLVKDVIQKQIQMEALDRSRYYNNQSSSEMPMIVALTIAGVSILSVVIGVSIYLKNKYKKNDKYEVATENNGKSFVIDFSLIYIDFFFFCFRF